MSSGNNSTDSRGSNNINKTATTMSVLSENERENLLKSTPNQFKIEQPTSPVSPSRVAQPSPKIGDKHYNRMKYYSSLKTNALIEEGKASQDKVVPLGEMQPRRDLQDWLDIPEHMLQINESAFVPSYGVDEQGKHGSFMTIFCTWNCMAGTALTVIPWAFEQSGVILGILLTGVAFTFSFYTCWLVMQTAGNDVDYTDTLRKQFGKPGYIVGMICFIINFSVPIILFFQLLAQDLYPVILYFIEVATGEKREIDHNTDWSQFSYSYTCIIIFVIVFAMTAPKNTSIYAKINSFGVIFICIIIVFTCGVGIYSLTNTTYTTDKAQYEEYLAEKAAAEKPEDVPYESYIALFQTPFAPLMGILGGGFYFHNFSLSVIRNARNPENNVRDVFLGYLATFITYVLCGLLGYYGFTGSAFEEKLQDPNLEGLIAQNSLDMFDVTNNLATFIRFCAFAQLLCVNALIIALERSQILLLITGTQEAPSAKINIMMNFLILIGPFLLAIWYPQVGTLASLGGSFATMLVVYFMPIVTYLKFKHSTIRNPEVANLVKRSTFNMSPSGSAEASPIQSVLEVSAEDQDFVVTKNYGSENRRKREFYFGLVFGTICCIYSVYVLVLQLQGLFGG